MRVEPYLDVVDCRAKLRRLGWDVQEVAGDGGMKVVGVKNSKTFLCMGGSSLVNWNGAVECAENIDSHPEVAVLKFPTDGNSQSG